MTKPCIVLSNAKNQCATFVWPDVSDVYVGYRFMEHRPETLDTPLDGIDALPRLAGERPEFDREKEPASGETCDPFGRGWATSYTEPDADEPIRLQFRAYADGSAWACGQDNAGAQTREFFFFEPAEDGVLMRMRLSTRAPITGAFAVQQCLRFSGRTNQAWRRPIACVPALSEFDLQAAGRPNDTLTYARRNGEWIRFPLPHTRFATPPGRPFLAAKGDGEVDHGLIVRESRDGKLSSGMYWERTAYMSNRHPADCLHACVDFGPLDAGAARTVYGKFYFVDGTKDDLLALWAKDFV
ncbi:MAG: hypothetical protein JXR37_19380 [Kiritimatiellae bacterium]|nr:hypothetical protein [Kiritimatiellia bacterium]